MDRLTLRRLIWIVWKTSVLAICPLRNASVRWDCDDPATDDDIEGSRESGDLFNFPQVLAAYSDACAVKGVRPAWRAAIRECGIFIIIIDHQCHTQRFFPLFQWTQVATVAVSRCPLSRWRGIPSLRWLLLILMCSDQPPATTLHQVNLENMSWSPYCNLDFCISVFIYFQIQITEKYT